MYEASESVGSGEEVSKSSATTSHSKHAMTRAALPRLSPSRASRPVGVISVRYEVMGGCVLVLMVTLLEALAGSTSRSTPRAIRSRLAFVSPELWRCVRFVMPSLCGFRWWGGKLEAVARCGHAKFPLDSPVREDGL